MSEPTDLQKHILREKRDVPDHTHQEIADTVGCSQSHVSQTLDQFDTADLELYDDPKPLSEVDTGTSSSDSSSDPAQLGKLILLPFYLTWWVLKFTLGLTWLMLKVTFGVLLLPLEPLLGD